MPDFFVNPQEQAANEIGHVASNCMSRAIIRGILAAKSKFNITAFRDLEDR